MEQQIRGTFVPVRLSLRRNVTQIFQKTMNHLNILDVRRMSWSNCHNEEPQVLRATAQSFVARATWPPQKMSKKTTYWALHDLYRGCWWVFSSTRKETSYKHVQIFMNDGPNPLKSDAQWLSYWFSRNPAVFQDKLVSMINNLRGGRAKDLSAPRYFSPNMW
jgi:hypothetical protein